LITSLAIDSSTAGQRGEELFHALRGIRNEQNAVTRVEQSRELIETVASWLEDFEINDEVGRDAVVVLEQESRPDDPALRDVSTLSAEVAAAPRQWGEQADTLLSDIHDLLGTTGTFQRSEQARDLVDNLEQWIASREIDVELGQHALGVIRPLRDSG
jgi:eukaryotic-like serine/threonine-protein kinase